jgi:hypothetical protein
MDKNTNLPDNITKLNSDEEVGSAKRTHGGVFYTGASPKLPDYEERQPAQWDKKRLIAAEAARLVENGDTVLLDGGSTTYEVARLLVGRRLQIVTNSLPVANLFASNANNDLVIVGGYVYPRTGVALGPLVGRAVGAQRRHLIDQRLVLTVRITTLVTHEVVTGPAVALGVLRLDDNTGARLDHGRRMHGPVRVEDLRHADFAADDSCHHM